MTTTRSAGPRLATTGVQPHEDYGFFGPGSVTWKVWGYPTSLTVGFQRSVVVEELDPNLVAAVDKTHDIYRRPRTRYDRTLRYFSMVAFGGSRETATAADVLVKIHSKAIGTEPYGGGRYDANDPASQLWIHLTAWHSILYAYEKYGPGPLSPHEEARYWQECAVAAELQTCSPHDVPRTRDGVWRYFEWMPVVAPIKLGVAPVNPEVVTPAQARIRYGLDRPADAHAELRSRQAARVFGAGTEPSDEGLVESEPILGRMR
jgi:uncharacterized protein (DUF2236 family)